MTHTCPRCSRVNPPQALFCYNDGASLGNGQAAFVDPGRQRFPMPFVFPCGKACHTFDELALACLDNWNEARDLLRQGIFAGFLGSLGRADLMRAARNAAKHPDRDRGLDELLDCLPTNAVTPSKLVVEPSQLNLGAMRPGQDGSFDLEVSNQGMGLMTGSISCEACPWLSIGDKNARRKLFQCQHEMTVRININGKSFRAANKPLEGRIVIESSGGQAAVAVTVAVPVQPFPDGIFAGCLTPRQVAAKAKQHPREAGPLFANGAVARWYRSNGWVYPVVDPSASGVAAVQQFFEALGLVTPPHVDVDTVSLTISGQPGEVLRDSFRVVAEEAKPVFAHAVSNQPWLLTDVELDGRAATIHLRIPEVPRRPGESLHAKVTVTANGRRRFVVPVSLDIDHPSGSQRLPRPRGVETMHHGVSQAVATMPHLPPIETLPEVPVEHRPLRRVPRDPDAAPPPPGSNAVRYLLAALPVVFLAAGLFVPLVRDVAAYFNGGPRVGLGGDDFGNAAKVVNITYHDQVKHVRLGRGGGVKPVGAPDVDTRAGTWEPSMRFGLVLGDNFGTAKRLTFDTSGLTNNAVVRLDGGEWLFGERPFRVGNQEQGTWPGRWHEMNGRPDRPLRDGRRSTWVYDTQQVFITQTVGLVPGEQSGRIDTCLVHYRIENRDRRPHVVGLRFLLDTFIGGNDGVPFLVPGYKQLVSSQMMFNRSEDVPDFIQARESEDLANPGTIAQIQLRVPGFEPPSRVTLGSWPNPALGGQCRQEKTLWDVPVLPIKSLPGGDSAVAIYWGEKALAAGASREMAFAYGLGSVSSAAGGRLALTVGGSFQPKGEFTLTAYVSNPTAGQSLTLALPEGFALVDGLPSQAVPPLPPDESARSSPVTWKIRAGASEGRFGLQVTSNTGVTQKQEVRIKQRGLFGS